MSIFTALDTIWVDVKSFANLAVMEHNIRGLEKEIKKHDKLYGPIPTPVNMQKVVFTPKTEEAQETATKDPGEVIKMTGEVVYNNTNTPVKEPLHKIEDADIVVENPQIIPDPPKPEPEVKEPPVQAQEIPEEPKKEVEKEPVKSKPSPKKQSPKKSRHDASYRQQMADLTKNPEATKAFEETVENAFSAENFNQPITPPGGGVGSKAK